MKKNSNITLSGPDCKGLLSQNTKMHFINYYFKLSL